MIALKQCYPQVYKSKQKLQIDIESVVVTRGNVVQAMRKLQPAAHRHLTGAHGRPLAQQVACCLRPDVLAVLKTVLRNFPFVSDAAVESFGLKQQNQAQKSC